jgi:MoxR-like ATPase
MTILKYTLNPTQLTEQLDYVFKSKLVPYIKSRPGEGKSDIIKQYAKEHGLLVIDIRLAQATPEDLHGFPVYDPETKQASFVPFNQFPLESCQIPEGYQGWLLFLDEL